MAQKIQTLLIDDLDGSNAEGTVLFGLDGSQYEIDLNTGHAGELRATLARYTEAARKVHGPARRSTQGRRRPAADGTTNAELRAWANAQGIEIKDRGRIPADVVARFREAAPR